MKITLVFIFLFVSPLCAREIKAPSSSEIQKLFGFKSNVKLQRKVLSDEKVKWRRKSQEEAGLLFQVTYEDRAQSSHSVVVSIYSKGTVLGMGIAEYKKKFNELDSSVKEHLDKMGLPVGTFTATDGREILSLFLGFGPGGSATGAVIPHKTEDVDVMVALAVNFHDEEDPKSFYHHTAPSKKPHEAIEEISNMVSTQNG